MKHYPVGLKWETKGYHCEILSTEIRSDGTYQWLSHNVEWKSKWGGYRPMIKQMSTKKLEKEFKRVGIHAQPVKEKHFSENLFEV